MPPYVPNLYIGELKDEEEGDEYVFLVSSLSMIVAVVWMGMGRGDAHVVVGS